MASLQMDGLLLETSCGSPHYACPEVIRGEKYDGRKADIWSCGVILYALLVGALPFDDENLRHLLEKVKRGYFHTPSFVSPECQELIKGMIEKDPDKRMTLAQVLNHSWVANKNEIIIEPPISQIVQTHIITSKDEIDVDILSCMLALACFKSEDTLIEQLLNPKHTMEKVIYFYLLDRKTRNPNYSDETVPKLIKTNKLLEEDPPRKRLDKCIINYKSLSRYSLDTLSDGSPYVSQYSPSEYRFYLGKWNGSRSFYNNPLPSPSASPRFSSDRRGQKFLSNNSLQQNNCDNHHENGAFIEDHNQNDLQGKPFAFNFNFYGTGKYKRRSENSNQTDKTHVINNKTSKLTERHSTQNKHSLDSKGIYIPHYRCLNALVQTNSSDNAKHFTNEKIQHDISIKHETKVETESLSHFNKYPSNIKSRLNVLKNLNLINGSQPLTVDITNVEKLKKPSLKHAQKLNHIKNLNDKQRGDRMTIYSRFHHLSCHSNVSNTSCENNHNNLTDKTMLLTSNYYTPNTSTESIYQSLEHNNDNKLSQFRYNNESKKSWFNSLLNLDNSETRVITIRHTTINLVKSRLVNIFFHIPDLTHTIIGVSSFKIDYKRNSNSGMFQRTIKFQVDIITSKENSVICINEKDNLSSHKSAVNKCEKDSDKISPISEKMLYVDSSQISLLEVQDTATSLNKQNNSPIYSSTSDGGAFNSKLSTFHITFTLLSGPVKRFNRLCDYIQNLMSSPQGTIASKYF
ncbi:unnamed protein product [Gordionus sp. m RMFG-2023]